MSLRTSLTPILVFLLVFGGCPAHAQTHWWLPSAAGYGAAGLGAGFAIAAAKEAELDSPMMALPFVGFAVGALGGGAVGRVADVRLSAGRELSEAHQTALGIGTIFAGAAVGALVAAVLIVPEDPRGGASDETTFIGMTAAGAAAGVWALHHWRAALRPRTRAGVAPGPDGSWSVVLQAQW